MQRPPAPRVGHAYAPPPRPPEDDWIAIVAESFIAVIEAGDGTGADRGIGALGRLVGLRNVELESIVSVIPVGGAGSDSFAVVHFDRGDDGTDEAQGAGGRVTAIARGRAVADVYSDGGSRRFSSSGVQPWLIATFRDVIAVELGGPARRSEAVARLVPEARAIGLGPTRVGAVLWSLAELRSPEVNGGRSGYARPAAALDEDTVLSIGGTGLDDTVRRSPGGAWDAGPSAASTPAPSADPTPSRSPSSSPSRRVDGAVDNAPDEETVLRVPAWREPASETAEPSVAEPGVAEPDAVAPFADITGGEATVSYTLVGDTTVADTSIGDVWDAAVADAFGDAPGGHPSPVLVGVRGSEGVLLDAPIVFGRRPAARARRGVQPLLVTVASPRSLVSASHLRVERVGDVVVVTDLRSRNGTEVTLPGVRPRRLRPGESIAVPGAAEVDIGDGTIIDITPVTP
ncbi:FHA domain-containing protein [Humibacter soli]